MPKGVEHTVTGVIDYALREVPTSVMPKGVEHLRTHKVKDRSFQVPTSVMPKGVEHVYMGGDSWMVEGADLCDAERR